jgi:3',5'-cyclic AMP phosphodiesterase CpdA
MHCRQLSVVIEDMRSIVHISDLHFGRINPKLLEPLVHSINLLNPHLVVVSGDLTQRARRSQYRQARSFLRKISHPMLIVPGNHDVPLYNVAARMFLPLRNYKKYISSNLSPFFRDEEIVVTGVSTARALTLIGGRINEQQIEEIANRLEGVPEEVIKIVVTHHPFDFTVPKKLLVGRAKKAMQTFSRLGIDLFLAGHFHKAHIGDTTKRYKIENYAALIVQAGSTTSTRQRGETPSFNHLVIDARTIEIYRYDWSPADSAYCQVNVEKFKKTPRGWVGAKR